MTRRVVRDYPPEVLRQMLLQLELSSVEIRCLVPGLHPTCWVKQKIMDSGYLVSYSTVSVRGWPGLSGHWAAYLALMAPVDDPELNLDHLCHTAPCWNPWHLDLVTQAVNNSRIGPRDELAQYRYAEGRRLR